MGRFCSERTCVGSSKSDVDANTCSCSLTRNSVDDKDATTCSTRQVSFLRGGDPTEGSRGSSCGSREHLFARVSEGGSHVRIKEHLLYHKLLYGGSTFQGAPGNGEGEGTRDSTRSFMDERPMEPQGDSARGGTEGSHGGHSQGSERIRWKDEASLASGGNERSTTTSHGRPWSIRKDARESQQQQESWSSRSRSASFQEVRHEQSNLSGGRDPKPDPEHADAERELSFSGSRGVAEREDDESAGHEKDDMEVEDESNGVQHWRSMEQSWLYGIVNQPVTQMAKHLHDVPDGSLEGLKVCLRDILGSSKRKDEFVALQRILQQRSDLTQDALLGSHRTQLAILVALKTGIPAFLHPDVALSTAAMTEIFLGTRCRNIGCQSPLPADFCGCKVCSSKWGFCNACMCGVCSKFDFDSNTCSWIGCDICLHWCHADCGIQMGHISSRKTTGRSGGGDPVMQFRCVACGHMSDLYGFVEEVFTACAKDWPLDVLARELQCIRRIFHRSDDLKGKQLFGKAEQLLVKLDTSRDVEAVWQSMMKFFAAGRKGALAPRPKAGVQVVRDAIPLPPGRKIMARQADAVREDPPATKARNGDGTSPEEEREIGQVSDRDMQEDGNEAAELLRERAWQRAQLKELESILEIKQAEAAVFQKRADEISREAEGLQRIVQAKIEKFDEEYNYKLLKLCASASLRREREGAVALRM